MKQINGSKSPHLLQQIQWVTNPLEYMDTCFERYGDIFSTSIVGKTNPFVFVSHPQGIQELLTRDTKEFEAPGRVNGILKPLLGEKSLILLDDKEHRRQRKLLMPPFHGERMWNYGQLIIKIAEQISSKWVQNQPFIARDAMQEISLIVILQTVFGMYEGERFQKIKTLLTSLLSLTDSPISSSLLFFPILQKDLGAWSPWGRFLRHRQQIDQLLFEEIEERRQQLTDENHQDILSLMMAARDEDGQPMSDIELRDELLTLLFAGHETTATALAWALYWVHQQPEVYQKLIQELDSLPADADPMTIYKLPYLTAVCQETLRIYPVGVLTFPRMAKQPTTLMGYSIPPDVSIMGCIYLLHRRPEIYPEPQQFKPERFLERKFSPYEYLPFGGGVRQCIGMALAQFEMRLVLATILRQNQLQLAEKRPVKAARRGVTLSPLGGVKMMMKGKRTLNSKSLATSNSV
ncbi:MAG: cytochrome P450 [Microcoleaceae cyanobacterium]